MSGLHGVAATLLVTAAKIRPDLHGEAAFAALCGVSPVDASSGKQRRHRFNRGGDRANSALWRIVFTRLACDPRTKACFAAQWPAPGPPARLPHRGRQANLMIT